MKKIITIIFIIIILTFVFGVYVFLNKENNNVYKPEGSNQGVVDDTDGDGLLDWQEDLYGTSVRLRDTDGDRVTDFEEVKNGHDPLVYGEGLSQEDIVPQTDIFGEPTIVFDEVLEGRVDFNFEIDKKTDGLNSDSELRNTINSLGGLVNSSYTSDTQDLILFGNLFAQSLTEEDRGKLLNISDLYQEIVVGIDAISNPALNIEIKNLRKNYLDLSQRITSLLESQDVDKQEYLQEVLLFNGEAYALQETLLSIHNYVKGNQINFQENEPGVFFLFSLNE